MLNLWFTPREGERAASGSPRGRIWNLLLSGGNWSCRKASEMQNVGPRNPARRTLGTELEPCSHKELPLSSCTVLAGILASRHLIRGQRNRKPGSWGRQGQGLWMEWSPGLFHYVQKLGGLPNELHQLFGVCKIGEKRESLREEIWFPSNVAGESLLVLIWFGDIKAI